MAEAASVPPDRQRQRVETSSINATSASTLTTTSPPRPRPRINRPRTGTNGTLESAYLPEHFDPSKPPPLDFTFNPRNPLLYLAFLLTCNVLIPCLLYYLPRIYTTISDKELIGIGSASLGLSSCFDAPFRMFRLTKRRREFGPLYYAELDHEDPTLLPAGQGKVMRKLPRNWWHLDFSMWTYQIGLGFFAIPLAIAPAIPLYNFFLFSTAMLIAPMGIIFILTLKTWTNLPFWMSSDPPRTKTKPACYYVVEDIGAVDFGHGRAWRKRMQARWSASPLFRRMMWNQTLYWSISSMVLVGITAAINWTTPLDVAYALVLGIFFAWALVSGFVSYGLVHFELKRELRWWKGKYSEVAGVENGVAGEGGGEMRQVERGRENDNSVVVGEGEGRKESLSGSTVRPEVDVREGEKDTTKEVA